MFTTALDALVEDGTITAAQQDAIADALSSAMPGAPGQGAPPSQDDGTGSTQTF